jgi:hypothetical protein
MSREDVERVRAAFDNFLAEKSPRNPTVVDLRSS